MSNVMEFALPLSSLPPLRGVKNPVLALHSFLSEAPCEDFDRKRLVRARWKLFFLGGVGRYSSAPDGSSAATVGTPPEGSLGAASSGVDSGEAPREALAGSRSAPPGVDNVVVFVLFVLFRAGFGGGRRGLSVVVLGVPPIAPTGRMGSWPPPAAAACELDRRAVLENAKPLELNRPAVVVVGLPSRGLDSF